MFSFTFLECTWERIMGTQWWIWQWTWPRTKLQQRWLRPMELQFNLLVRLLKTSFSKQVGKIRKSKFEPESVSWKTWVYSFAWFFSMHLEQCLKWENFFKKYFLWFLYFELRNDYVENFWLNLSYWKIVHKSKKWIHTVS